MPKKENSKERRRPTKSSINSVEIKQDTIARHLFGLKPVFRLAIFGPPGSGKTTLLTDFIEHIDAYFDADDVKVLYCYSSLKPDFRTEVYLHRGVPAVSDIISLSSSAENLVVVFDDLLTDFANLRPEEKSAYSSFVTDYSRKLNISCILVSQEIYHTKADFLRQFIKAMSHVILFRISTDRLSLQRFATQVYAHNRSHFLTSYHRATEGGIGGYLTVPLSFPAPDQSMDMHLRNFMTVPRQGYSKTFSTVFPRANNFIYEDRT